MAIGGVAAQLSFTVLEIFIARQLGRETFGIFATAYAWTLLAVFVIEMGTPFWIIQEGSRAKESLSKLLGSSLAVNLTVFVVLYGLLICWVLIMPPSVVRAFMVIFFPYGLILCLQSMLGAVYSSQQRMHINALYQGLAPIAVLLAYLIVLRGGISLKDVGHAYVIGGGIVTAIWFVHTVRNVDLELSKAGIAYTLRGSSKYAVTGILGQVFFKTDVVMLSAIAGFKAAGVYAAAFKLVELAAKIAILVSRVFSPALFKASHESPKTYWLLTSSFVRFLSVAGLTATIIAFVMAEELMLILFGREFADGAPVLRILSAVMATKFMMIAMQQLLSSLDRHIQRVKGIAIAVVVNLALNAGLIPLFGAEGAAVATLLSGIFLVYIYVLLSGGTPLLRFRRWLLAPSCIVVALCAATYFIDLDVILEAAIALALFIASLFAIRLVTFGEIAGILRVLLPQQVEKPG